MRISAGVFGRSNRVWLLFVRRIDMWYSHFRWQTAYSCSGPLLVTEVGGNEHPGTEHSYAVPIPVTLIHMPMLRRARASR
jgi:hypothetical protein